MGIRAFLQKYPTLHLIQITNRYATLVQLCQEDRPDVILFFTSPSVKQDTHFLGKYYEENQTPILLLALAYDKNHFCQVLEAGIHGYLLLGVDDELLASAIQTVAVGGRWFSPMIDSTLFRQALTSHAPPVSHSGINEITDRERQIMQLIAQERSNHQIGQALGVTERTVRFHMRNIYDKLNFATRAEVIVWMLKSELNLR
jgi:DNA-binding NarL/FixJ family response regulator